MPSLPIPQSTLDRILTAQLAVAWAGEGGKEDPRLGWWQTELISEFGGEALFQDLLPNTWRWATWQSARQAALRFDEIQRKKDFGADRLVTIFHLGFDVDERLDDRFRELKGGAYPPAVALPELGALIENGWQRSIFEDWVAARPRHPYSVETVGRRLHGAGPDSLLLLVEHLVGALAPLPGSYPLPHYRVRG